MKENTAHTINIRLVSIRWLGRDKEFLLSAYRLLESASAALSKDDAIRALALLDEAIGVIGGLNKLLPSFLSNEDVDFRREWATWFLNTLNGHCGEISSGEYKNYVDVLANARVAITDQVKNQPLTASR